MGRIEEIDSDYDDVPAPMEPDDEESGPPPLEDEEDFDDVEAVRPELPEEYAKGCAAFQNDDLKLAEDLLMKACSRTTTPEHLLKAATELARALVAQEKFPLSEGVLCSADGRRTKDISKASSIPIENPELSSKAFEKGALVGDFFSRENHKAAITRLIPIMESMPNAIRLNGLKWLNMRFVTEYGDQPLMVRYRIRASIAHCLMVSGMPGAAARLIQRTTADIDELVPDKTYHATKVYALTIQAAIAYACKSSSEALKASTKAYKLESAENTKKSARALDILLLHGKSLIMCEKKDKAISIFKSLVKYEREVLGKARAESERLYDMLCSTAQDETVEIPTAGREMVCNKCSKLAHCLEAKFICSSCKTVYYCSESCQKDDWKEHKKPCKAIRKKQAAGQ